MRSIRDPALTISDCDDMLADLRRQMRHARRKRKAGEASVEDIMRAIDRWLERRAQLTECKRLASTPVLEGPLLEHREAPYVT